MKKEKKITNKKKEETESEKQDLEDDGTSISSQAPSNLPKEDKKKEESNLGIIGNGIQPNLGIETNSIYDWKMLYDTVLKIATVNYAGNSMLSWGQIKLQL